MPDPEGSDRQPSVHSSESTGQQREATVSPTASGPRMSVVVTIVDGAGALERCLDALEAQRGSPPLEVLVPYDDSVSGVSALAARFPHVVFLPMGTIATDRPIASASGQHELFDRRRAAGLAEAGGDLVAIIEDRGVPGPEWAATFAQIHAEHGDPVIGGPIQNGIDKAMNWAVYFCDFGRYQLPFEFGPRAYVSDVNICYKREALERTRHLWEERYHETTVHWELQKSGCELQLSPTPAVYQHRTELTLGRLLGERFHWGRLFAYTRAREIGAAARIGRALTAVLLPPLLFARLVKGQLARKTKVGRFLAVSPLVATLLTVWSAGEALGYLTGRP